jgi:hypothetical protein
MKERLYAEVCVIEYYFLVVLVESEDERILESILILVVI